MDRLSYIFFNPSGPSGWHRGYLPTTARMAPQLTILNCGRNGSGFSAAISLYSSNYDDEAYEIILINVGDSTQKFCNEYKIKLRKVSCVFFTSLAPHNVCGLPALILSLSDLGNKTLNIIGQIGIRNLLESMRGFTNRR
jgi:ribonuclease BN (tRNA processing enzyme)